MEAVTVSYMCDSDYPEVGLMASPVHKFVENKNTLNVDYIHIYSTHTLTAAESYIRLQFPNSR